MNDFPIFTILPRGWFPLIMYLYTYFIHIKRQFKTTKATISNLFPKANAQANKTLVNQHPSVSHWCIHVSADLHASIC